ncbi:MAG TPA: hypothetical protein VG206_13130 [Terriglobia bacterium]|nr:hypothetical protein [Terriglobia bacterium]
MEHEGALHIVRTGESDYSVKFTANDPGKAAGVAEAERTFGTEAAFAEFLLDAGLGAQHSDGIQGALHSVGHHTIDVHFSERQFRRLFPQVALRAGR